MPNTQPVSAWMLLGWVAATCAAVVLVAVTIAVVVATAREMRKPKKGKPAADVEPAVADASQCDATYTSALHTWRCTRPMGHGGMHFSRSLRASWANGDTGPRNTQGM